MVAKGYIKVTTNLDKNDKAIISQLKDAGYTVKYRFYRSTKKAAGWHLPSDCPLHCLRLILEIT